jgi:RimJ/RimL family protein N-acetyltransferase
MDKLGLRAFQESDLDNLVNLANNKEVSRYLIDTFPYPYTKENAIWWLQEDHHQNDMVNYAITLQDELIGGIGITPNRGWRSHLAEIGYWLGEPYWNKGYTTWALTKMTVHAFVDLKIKKLYAPVFEENFGSMRVLEKCGFYREGLLNLEIFKDGAFHNIHYFAKINPDEKV